MNTDILLIKQYVLKHPFQASLSIEKLKDNELGMFINKLDLDFVTHIFSVVNPYKLSKCLVHVDDVYLKELLEKIDIQLLQTILRHLEPTPRKALLKGVSPKRASAIRKRLEYSDCSVGALMNPIMISFKKETTVRDAIKLAEKKKEFIHSCLYVVDDEGKLQGIVSLDKLLFSDPLDSLSLIMETEVPTFLANIPAESVADHEGWCSYQSIPVIDSLNVLIGSITLRAIRKLNVKTNDVLPNHMIETTNALSELYRIGFTGILQSIYK